MARNKRKHIKQKYMEERHSIPPITPINDKQRLLLSYLDDDSIKCIIASGIVASGKTWLCASHAARQLRLGNINKVFIARPNEPMTRSQGTLPGTSLEKLQFYLAPILNTLKEWLGNNIYRNALKDGVQGNICIVPTESIRGMSLDEPCIFLVDEAQNLSKKDLIAILTRVGEGCKIVLTGDTAQVDIKHSGLKWLEHLIDTYNIPATAHVSFDSYEYIVRSDFVRNFVIAMEREAKHT